MVVSSIANEAVKKFMDDFYLRDKGEKFLADIDFSFNAHRKIAEGWVTIAEQIPGNPILLNIECLHCDADSYPLYLDGNLRETYKYIPYKFLEVHGDHPNPAIGKFRVCITPRETTW